MSPSAPSDRRPRDRRAPLAFPRSTSRLRLAPCATSRPVPAIARIRSLPSPFASPLAQCCARYARFPWRPVAKLFRRHQKPCPNGLLAGSSVTVWCSRSPLHSIQSFRRRPYPHWPAWFLSCRSSPGASPGRSAVTPRWSASVYLRLLRWPILLRQCWCAHPRHPSQPLTSERFALAPFPSRRSALAKSDVPRHSQILRVLFPWLRRGLPSPAEQMLHLSPARIILAS